MTTLELLNAITVVADALPADDFINRLRLSMVQEDVQRRAAAEVVEEVVAVPVVREPLRLVKLEDAGRCPACGALPNHPSPMLNQHLFDCAVRLSEQAGKSPDEARRAFLAAVGRGEQLTWEQKP